MRGLCVLRSDVIHPGPDGWAATYGSAPTCLSTPDAFSDRPSEHRRRSIDEQLVGLEPFIPDREVQLSMADHQVQLDRAGRVLHAPLGPA